jgi:hypothetical protein
MSSIGQSICDQVGCTIDQLDDWLQSAPDPIDAHVGYDPDDDDLPIGSAAAASCYAVGCALAAWSDRYGILLDDDKIIALVSAILPDDGIDRSDWIYNIVFCIYDV